jgi:tripartite-type tricarboxylate transporter receptor subunit TctC
MTKDRAASLRRGVGVILCALVALSARPVFAQNVEEFYKTHAITLIVSSGSGGGYDTYSRMLARFLPSHIPGQPRIVVENMPGAGSRVALNYVANVAVRDGTIISDADSIMPFSALLEGENTKFDPLKLNWLGSMAKQISICVAWNKGSFKTLDDVMQRPMRVSGNGAAGWRVTLPRIYDSVSGAKLEPVPGYSSTEAFLAVERGEVDGTCPTYDTLLATNPDWLLGNKVKILMQFGLEPTTGLEGVPFALDKVKDATDRAAVELLLSQQLTGRPYLTSPDIPTDRLRALRTAFDVTMTDPEFMAEAQKVRLWIDPLSSAQMGTLMKEAYATPPQIIDRAKLLLAQASAN